MAGNFGKFIDRSPIMCPAGKPNETSDTVANTLREFNVEDEITALKHDAHIWREDEFVLPRKLPPLQNKGFLGVDTQIKPLLNPPIETRYQQFIDDIKSTPYSSYWNLEIGKTRDPVPGLPAGTDRYEMICGKPSTRDIPLKEIVNPSKSHYDVLVESQVGHELYKRSHNDYNPSERVCRGYCKPPYNPDKTYGIRSRYDPRGIWVKCACQWFMSEPVTIASKIQADHFLKVKPGIGKFPSPNNNIKLVPPGFTFGDKTKRDFYGVDELLKDPEVPPSLFKRDLYESMASLNKLRLMLKERTHHGFNFDNFYKRLLYLDTEKTGYVPMDLFYEVCACNDITYHKDEVELLLKNLKIIENGQIDYRMFVDLVDVNQEMIDIGPINDIPNDHKYYVTSQQAASCDWTIIDNSQLPTAGVPSVRYDLPRPTVPEGGCRADLDNLGDNTTARSVLNPSIYTNYGLNFRDFYMPRSPETIRTLFEKIGYNFPNDTFEKLWKIGVEKDKTGLVCVQTFKELLQMDKPKTRPLVDETEIDCEKTLEKKLKD